MSAITMVPARTREDLEAMAVLADEIWHEHYTPIIGEAQVRYMLDKFQTADAMAQQIQEGYLYFFFCSGDRRIGYTAICPEDGRLLLSKLYVRKSERRQGAASLAMDYIRNYCREHGLSSVYLHVNRDNEESIAAYHKLGFHTAETRVTDIGEGYVMDDRIMQVNL